MAKNNKASRRGFLSSAMATAALAAVSKAQVSPKKRLPAAGHEPHKDVFLLLTFWIAATNDNTGINKLDDGTILTKMGLDPSTFADLVKHVGRQTEIYSIIRQEFTEVSALFNGAYTGGQCPAYPETLNAVSNLVPQ